MKVFLPSNRSITYRSIRMLMMTMMMIPSSLWRISSQSKKLMNLWWERKANKNTHTHTSHGFYRVTGDKRVDPRVGHFHWKYTLSRCQMRWEMMIEKWQLCVLFEFTQKLTFLKATHALWIRLCYLQKQKNICI